MVLHALPRCRCRNPHARKARLCFPHPLQNTSQKIPKASSALAPRLGLKWQCHRTLALWHCQPSLDYRSGAVPGSLSSWLRKSFESCGWCLCRSFGEDFPLLCCYAGFAPVALEGGAPLNNKGVEWWLWTCKLKLLSQHHQPMPTGSSWTQGGLSKSPIVSSSRPPLAGYPFFTLCALASSSQEASFGPDGDRGLLCSSSDCCWHL